MSTASQNNNESQEIDLSAVSKTIGNFFENISTWIFKGVLFLKRNILPIGLLFLLGLGFGIYLDKTIKTYDSQIIVIPNYETTDYLYSRIDLINSKIKENDTIFLKETVGIKNPKRINEIRVEPIIDVYRFINKSDKNFEFVKLLAEDGDLKQIVTENLTSKNYTYHVIKFSTSKKTNLESTVQPILNYINESVYYKQMQKEYLNNLKIKLASNDSVITQIDGVLNSFSNAVNGSQRNDKLIYYNENTQLNDVIKTKDELIKEQGDIRLSSVNLDKIIKDSSVTMNIKNERSINGKLKFILPFLLVFLFIVIVKGKNHYKREMSKL